MSQKYSDLYLPLTLLLAAGYYLLVKALGERARRNPYLSALMIIVGGFVFLFIESSHKHKDPNSYMPGYLVGLFFLLVGIMVFLTHIPWVRKRAPKIVVNSFRLKSDLETGDNEQESTKFRREYQDATLSSPYYIAILLFMILPSAIIYFILPAMIKGDSGTRMGLLIMALFVFIFLAVAFVFFRKYYVFKIKIDNEGVEYKGFFRNIHAYWNEVKSVGVYSLSLIEVKTVKGNFFFPKTLKEVGREFPKLKYYSLTGPKWIDSQGNETPMTPEYCPLYVDIQTQLGSAFLRQSEVSGKITETTAKDIIRRCMRLNWIIWGAMLLSLGVFILICHIAKEELKAEIGKGYPIAFIALGLLIVTTIQMACIPLLRNFILRAGSKDLRTGSHVQYERSVIDIAINKFTTALIVSLAIAEIVAIYGVVLFFISGDFRLLYFFNAIAAIAMLIYRPRASEFEKLNATK